MNERQVKTVDAVMCIDVGLYRGAGEVFCHTRGELETALGGPLVDDFDMCGIAKPEHCLCAVNLPATAERYGLQITTDPEERLCILKP